VLRPLTTRVPAFGLLAERESDSNFEALRLQKRLRFLTEVPIRIRQVRHINGSLLFRVSRLVLGSRHLFRNVMRWWDSTGTYSHLAHPTCGRVGSTDS
jgi:hypothetical protein